ncbi:dedicator of cytokinesis protein 9-like isoform X2 [Daphnia pulex]|uniref:dedicator of cytokinesis protein 9-like isoform X2 n=1 Tax=Daphnia pulex TaxID=6669 RepID=UPI001EE0DBD2|nr:dedicator of cytokinesis protein 9-like isoform X2 [Daphnia pulex]
MAERKFSRGLRKPGMAAQLRESVSQVVRETAVQSKPQRAEPIDYEAVLAKNRIIFNNDPHRELLLFPPEDVSQSKIARQCRTTKSTVPEEILQNEGSYFTQKCAQFYTCDWSTLSFKYRAYSGSCLDLPRLERLSLLTDPKHEVDVEGDADDEMFSPESPPTLEGYLLKGPEGASEKMFANIATKSFKRRFCKLRQDITGSYFLDICKEDKKQDAALSISLDECEDVVANKRKNKFGFQLRLVNQRSYVFAASSESELNNWLEKLCMAVHSSKQFCDDRRSLPDPELALKSTKVPSSYGTLRSLESSLNPQLTKYARETEMSISLARRENRNLLFNLSPIKPFPGASDSFMQTKVKPFEDNFGHRFFARCESINFRLQAPIDGDKGPLGQVEPYFITLALYDLKLNKKITEDFHSDVNHPLMKAVIQSIQANSDEPNKIFDIPGDWLAFPKQAVFSVRHIHSEVFLVIRIETILQGSVVTSAEPYVRPNSDIKTGLKVQKSARSYCSRLGRYRMPFAWAARPLFRSSGELDTTSEISTIYRQESHRNSDEDLIKTLNDFRRPEKLSRLTIIPGMIRVTVEHLKEAMPNMLTASLVPIKPFPLPPVQEPTIEIAEFPTVRVEDGFPYMSYVNHLYVYPRSLKYDTQKTFHRARNIACVIELRDSDAKDAQPLKSIYGQVGQLQMVSQWVCSVSHHITSPCWMDEIKINLPTSLNNKHHLLFTFLHISCDLSKQKKDRDNKEVLGPEVVVGYSWLPLMHKGRLRIEQQSLPVSAHLPPGYLSFEPLGLGRGYAGPEIRWVDGQKPIFQVHLELVSTVTARDQHLHNFFLHMAKLNETRSIASLFPTAAELDAHKPLEEAPKSPAIQENGSRELSKLVKALHAVDVTEVVHHLPVVLNQLMWLMVRINSEELSVNVIKVLIHIVNQLHEFEKANILDAYLEYVFVTPTLTESANKATVHEEMVKTLCVLLRPSNTDFLVMHKFLRHANFFLKLITRSMAQHILESGRIKMQRQERFHMDYMRNVESLVETISPHIQIKYKDLPDETRHANLAIAEFVKKCLSLMDRGFAFRLVSIYLNTFRPDDPRALYELKFQFLQSVCFHEHYIPLNFPRAPNWAAMQKSMKELDMEFRLCDSFCRSHYLAGLILQEVSSALNEVADIRRIALRCLKDLLAKHELDDRYQNKGHQSRIASLYLPWIFIVLDNWNRLNVLSVESTGPSSSTASAIGFSSIASPSVKTGKSLSLPRNIRPPVLTPVNSWKRNPGTPLSQTSSPVRSDFNPNRNSSYLAIIAGQGVPCSSSQATLTNGGSVGSLGESDSSSTMSLDRSTVRESPESEKGVQGAPRESTDTEKTDKDKIKTHSRNASLVISNTPVIRYDKLQPDEVKEVLLCLMYVLRHADEGALIAWWHNASQHDLICFFHILELSLRQFKYMGRKRFGIMGDGNSSKSSTLPPRVPPPVFGSRPSTCYEPDGSSCSDGDSTYRSLLESNLTIEVGLIVLDAVGLFCLHFKEALLSEDGDNPLMRKVLDIYLSFLQIGQSESLSKHVFAALRAFINSFPLALYQGNAWLCGRLCCELLRCCASKLSLVRQEACAVLYLLMRSNFEFSGQKALTRVHLQVIISVSQLLGEIGGLNSTRFGESLNVINGFASSDKAMQSTVFPGEVRDLTKRAQTVLRATLQMRQQAQDPELLIDLQHSLANSYSATPELRKTWLETMAHHHTRLGNWSEVAQCRIHVAALITEYLYRRGLRQQGCETFSSLSPNIVQDESNLRLDTGIHDTQYDEAMLLEQLEECSRAVEKAERYEMQLEIYRLILPTYEKQRDYVALAECFSVLSQACSRANEVNRTGKRLLGTYYRVALYGKARFGDEAGTEYIYKEPKVTNLSEIAERLNRMYCAKFGTERVKLAMDSNPIEDKDMEPQMAYVQITHVVPYFEENDLTERVTEYERNHNINRFMYEIPFTTDGRVRGSPEDQCKKRIILTTQYSFPYIKKRLRVIQREFYDLSPIEVALDEMRLRVKDIAEAVRTVPTDLKKLQLRLQGSISVQVNAGPLAYASAFLVHNTQNYPDEQIQQLQELYRDFVHICGAALELNGKLILPDQREYHEALRTSFRDLVNSLGEIFDDPSLNRDWDGSISSNPFLKRNSVLVFSSGVNNSTDA